MKVFSGSSNTLLAERIAEQFGMHLSPLEIHVFPDGERRVRVEKSVVDEEVLVVQSTASPVDQNYMELFFMVDALKRSGARSVTAVVPYLGYQRQDHIFRDGEAVSLEVVVKTLESTGLDALVVYDLHSIKIPEVFTIPVLHLSALPIFAEHIKKITPDLTEVLLVSPDMGGIRRIKIVSELLGKMPYVALNKNRDLNTGEITTTEIGESTGGIKKKAFIVDDMASSGKTLVEAAKFLVANGAEEIYAMITHGVFSQDAPKLLEASLIKTVFVTDSVFVPIEKQFPKLTILSVAQETVEKMRQA